jgi:hypothetical protein
LGGDTLNILGGDGADALEFSEEVAQSRLALILAQGRGPALICFPERAGASLGRFLTPLSSASETGSL